MKLGILVRETVVRGWLIEAVLFEEAIIGDYGTPDPRAGLGGGLRQPNPLLAVACRWVQGDCM